MRSDRRVRASWRQATIHGVVQASPLERAADGSGRALVYQVQLANGSTAKLAADVVCERLSNEHGERIVLTVDRAAHVVAAHMRGQRGGVFLPGMTLTRVLGLFRRHWHEPLGHAGGSRKIKVLCERVVGTSGVASARELAECGVLSDADLRRLASVKEQAFSANVHGSARDRAALVERVNRRWRASNVRLTVRNNVVLPAFIAAPQPTRSFVIVLDQPRAPGHERRIQTMHPGELLRDPPSDARYSPMPSDSGRPAGATVGDLQRRSDRGDELSDRERRVLGAYRRAFDVWYDHGPLLPLALGRGGLSRKPPKREGGRGQLGLQA